MLILLVANQRGEIGWQQGGALPEGPSAGPPWVAQDSTLPSCADRRGAHGKGDPVNLASRVRLDRETRIRMDDAAKIRGVRPDHYVRYIGEGRIARPRTNSRSIDLRVGEATSKTHRPLEASFPSAATRSSS